MGIVDGTEFAFSQIQEETIDQIHSKDQNYTKPENGNLDGWNTTTGVQIYGNQMVWGAKRDLTYEK